MKKSMKIIGAVLGVLLVAALFTGAGAATTYTDTILVGVGVDRVIVGTNDGVIDSIGGTATAKTMDFGDSTAVTVRADLCGTNTYFFVLTGVTATDEPVTATVKGTNGDTLGTYKVKVVELGTPILLVSGNPTEVNVPGVTSGFTAFPTVSLNDFTLSTDLKPTARDGSKVTFLGTLKETVTKNASPALLYIDKFGLALSFNVVNNTPETGAPYVAYVPYLADDNLGASDKTWYLVDTHSSTYPYPTVDEPYKGHDTYTGTTAVHTAKIGTNAFYFYDLKEEGVYRNAAGDKTITIVFPTVDATAQVTNGTLTYGLEGNFVPKTADYTIKLIVADPKNAAVAWQLVDADGNVVELLDVAGGQITADKFAKYKDGIYGLQPVLVDYLVDVAPANLKYGEPIYFTLGKAADATLALSADKVIVGENVIATATGLPGEKYTIKVSPAAAVTIPKQLDVTVSTAGDEATFTMPAAGFFDLTVKAKTKAEEVTFTLTPSNEDATLEILDGIITAETEFDAYTIGDTIKFLGTASTADPLYFYIEGQNVKFTQIFKEFNEAVAPYTGKTALDASGYEWDAKLKYDFLYKSLNFIPDAGTYTFYVSTNDASKAGKFADGTAYTVGTSNKKDYVTDGTYVTVPVLLKQSFINLVSVPTVVAQGEKIVIDGTANAAESVIWYLFGNNYFSTGVQKVKDDVFTIKIDGKYTESTEMAAGQYFIVVQHPMYDKEYSIAPADLEGKTSPGAVFNYAVPSTGIINKFDKGYFSYATGALVDVTKNGGTTTKAVAIFGSDFRQTANAAQALCDALDSQNFDDMYAKASFIVGAPTSVINPIPAKITQGETLVVSGTTTGHKGEIVTLDFRGTAFAPVVKQQTGSASYVTLTTKVQDDGTWAIEYDTTGADCDDYTLSVAVGSLAPSTAKISIVKAGGDQPTVQPTGEPTAQPTTVPTATPATPGFGILAALAGLGAVAVLLLRRQ